MLTSGVSPACALAAQDNTELLNRMKAMEDRIKALEAEVQTLKGAAAGAAAAVAPAAPSCSGAMPPAAPAAVPRKRRQAQDAAPQWAARAAPPPRR